MTSDYDLEDARTVINNFSGYNPMTSDPWFNFLIDTVLGLVDYEEWDEIKDIYYREVEAYKEEDVDLEPYEVEELL